MPKIKLENGVTMLVLVITIVVLLILAGVSINFAIKDADFTIEKKQLSELEMVGHAVYQQYIKYKETGTEDYLVGETYSLTDNDTITTDIDGNRVTVNPDGWYKLSKSDLEKIGIKKSAYEYIVKYSTGEVYNITAKTSKQNGKTLYARLSDGYVTVGEIFDINGKNVNDEGYNPNKLHIGDFINYDAGTWTQEEINNIKVGPNENLVSASGSTDVSKTSFQFFGFEANMSRNDNAIKTHNEYIKDISNNPVAGWRVFDVSDDNITLISAGCPEDYCHRTDEGDFPGYISEYILSQNINSNWYDYNNYIARNWNNYINKSQKAISATSLSRNDLNNWYKKYLNTDEIENEKNFQKIYGTQYESLIDIYAGNWIADTGNFPKNLRLVHSDSQAIINSYGRPLQYGVRVLVTLSSNVKILNTPSGTKTVVDPRNSNNSWTYNVWDIK